MTANGWGRRFETPIALPDGRELVMLRDAGEYIASLPAKTARQDHWQTAASELLISAEQRGIIMLAEIAKRKAIHHGRSPPAKAPPAAPVRYRARSSRNRLRILWKYSTHDQPRQQAGGDQADNNPNDQFHSQIPLGLPAIVAARDVKSEPEP